MGVLDRAATLDVFHAPFPEGPRKLPRSLCPPSAVALRRPARPGRGRRGVCRRCAGRHEAARRCHSEGRSTLRSLDRRFDVIQFIAVDTFAALDAGAYVLSENYLYTVEAFADMFNRLEPDGILAFYRWLFSPPRETLRLSALACEA